MPKFSETCSPHQLSTSSLSDLSWAHHLIYFDWRNQEERNNAAILTQIGFKFVFVSGPETSTGKRSKNSRIHSLH